MNAVRLIVLAVAALAAVFAAVFVRSAMQPAAAPAPVVVEQVAEPEVVQVLVAARDMSPSLRISGADFRWTNWPAEAVLPAYITRDARPDAMEEFTGAVTRAAFVNGEPILPGKLVQPGDAGFMAAVIDPGMRAVAVPISAESGAGGFILPNDRVDVLVTTSARDLGYVSELLVENVRVLAIDQTYVDDGESVVLGSTATLELTPGQTRAVALGVAEGDIVLALRSVADREGGPRLSDGSAEDETGRGREVRIIRYGAEQRVALGGTP